MVLAYPLFVTLALSYSSTWIFTLIEVLLILAFILCKAYLDKALWLQGVVRFLPDCADLDQHTYALGLHHWMVVQCMFLQVFGLSLRYR